MIDEVLIRKLRSTVSDNSEFLYYEYSDVNGKNLWNCICSCMDWIEIAVDYINSFEFTSENSHRMSMNIFSFISAVDIISDAVSQLDRVINKKVNGKPLFHSKNEIFNDSQKDDNEHFKEIRAAFGAHPTSLGEPGEKKFAGWSTNRTSTEYDFSVLLYNSNSQIKEDEEFGFKIEKLTCFLNSRYNYLDEIVNQLNSLRVEFNQTLARTLIVRDRDVFIDLDNLEMEIVKRRAEKYFKSNICITKRFFSTEITNNLNKGIVCNYLNELRKEIEEIALRLQNMDFENLNSDNILHPKYPSQLRNDFEKVYRKLEHPDYSGMYDYHLEQVKKYLKDLIIIDKNHDYDQVYLLINAALYKKNEPDS